MVNENFRFPFASGPDISSRTAIAIFSGFGLPSFVHSDRDAACRGRQTISSKARSCVVQQPWALPSNLEGSLRQTGLKFFPMRWMQKRSLLRTTTNATPLERLFYFQRLSVSALPCQELCLFGCCYQVKFCSSDLEEVQSMSLLSTLWSCWKWLRIMHGRVGSFGRFFSNSCKSENFMKFRNSFNA